MLAATVLLVDRGYDADFFRNSIYKVITPYIPFKKNRKVQIEHNTALCKRRHKIENMFGCVKDWRTIAMRFVRHADIFVSACALAAIVLFW